MCNRYTANPLIMFMSRFCGEYHRCLFQSLKLRNQKEICDVRIIALNQRAFLFAQTAMKSSSLMWLAPAVANTRDVRFSNPKLRMLLGMARISLPNRNRFAILFAFQDAL